MRYALPNARVLIHQPHGGAQGQSTDIEIQVREMVEMRERMVDVLVRATGQPRERIIADIDRDHILRGEDGRRLRPGRRASSRSGPCARSPTRSPSPADAAGESSSPVASVAMADALFSRLDAGRVLPGTPARGPWSPDALHGGPVAALLGRCRRGASSRTCTPPGSPSSSCGRCPWRR